MLNICRNWSLIRTAEIITVAGVVVTEVTRHTVAMMGHDREAAAFRCLIEDFGRALRQT
jgi:hypothetical protein